MEILSGSGHKEDPLGGLVMCKHERVATAMNIWIPAYFWMRWGVNVSDDFSMYSRGLCGKQQQGFTNHMFGC